MGGAPLTSIIDVNKRDRRDELASGFAHSTVQGVARRGYLKGGRGAIYDFQYFEFHFGVGRGLSRSEMKDFGGAPVPVYEL